MPRVHFGRGALVCEAVVQLFWGRGTGGCLVRGRWAWSTRAASTPSMGEVHMGERGGGGEGWV